MMRQWITYLTLLFITVSATAQIFAPIDQTFAFKKRTELGRRLSVARPDSNKLLLLLDIGNAYLKSNAPDSALFYSGQAVDLARRLRRQDEEGQGRFLIVRADAMKGDILAAETVTSTTTGIWKMRMLQELSEHYSFRPGMLPANLDTAWRYIRQLIALTDTMHSMTATQNTRAVLGKYYYTLGDTKTGMDYFRQNILEWQRLGNKEQEAHWWSELGLYTTGTPDNTPVIRGQRWRLLPWVTFSGPNSCNIIRIIPNGPIVTGSFYPTGMPVSCNTQDVQCLPEGGQCRAVAGQS